MKRYLPSIRTRSGSSARGTSEAQLRDQFLRQLKTEAESLLKQFTNDLQSQSSRILEGLGSGNEGGFGGDASVNKLFATGVRYLISRPTTNENTAETARSQEATAGFRVSQAQALAEANQLISKGEKNL